MRPLPGRAFALRNNMALDHAEFRVAAAGWKQAFAAQPGTRWALYFDDTAAFISALYGAWHAGKTVVLCADTLPVTLAQLSDQVDGLAGDLPEGYTTLQPMAVRDDGSTWSALDAQTTRLQVYTSGSTGAAQAIDKSLTQLAAEVESLQSVFGAQAADAVVQGTVSHQHIYGLLFRALWPLAAARVIAPRLFFHEEIAAALAQRPALLVTSPAHLKRLPEGVDWAQARSQLRVLFSSGGALPEDAARAAQMRLGQVPIEIFGSSETGGIAWRQGAAAAWRALPGVHWRIAEGQLEVCSPHLPNADWWRSADRVAATLDGGFNLLGRSDRIVKVEERRVSLTALEQALCALTEVAEARVLLLDGHRAELAAVIVPSVAGKERLAEQGALAFGQQLRRMLAEVQDAVARPRRWRFVDALPMNAQGKTTDAALRALFLPLQPQVTWMQREAQQVQLQLSIDPALAVFDGHFPGMPILPGVAQLDWAVQFGREAFAIDAHVLRVDALKFQRIVRPGMQLALVLEWLPDLAALVFRYTSEQGAHSSGRVLFALEKGGA